jgi:hypothetical protein
VNERWEDDPDATVRLRGEQVMWSKVREEVVALVLDTSEYVSVNRSATALWEMLVTGATVRQLKRTLAARWELTEEQADHDVDTFLAELSAAGLLER